MTNLRWAFVGLVAACLAGCATPGKGGAGGVGPADTAVAADVVLADAQPADVQAASDAVAAVDATSPADLSQDLLAVADQPSSADAAAIDAGPDAAADASAPKPALTQAAIDAALGTGDASKIQALVGDYDMPVCAAGSCTFLVLAKGTKTVEIMGDWAGWNTPAAMSAVPAVAGLFQAKITLDASQVREYKVKLDGAWAMDPSNPYFRFAGLGPNSAIYPSGSSRLRRFASVQSPQLGNTRDLYVYLPAAYFTNPTMHFPVMYWHDGFNVFSNPKAPFGDWKIDQTSDVLMASGAVEPIIAVGIDTDDRMSEYVWGPLDDGKVIHPPKIDKYAEFLVSTVKPLIDKSLRTLADRDHTAIGGSSLGGNASLWIGWNHWQTFGRLASFSGALWVGEDAISGTGKSGQGVPMRQLIAQNLPKVPIGALRIYMDCGDSDFDGAVCYECDSWVYSDWTRNALITLGWDNRLEWDTDADLKTAPSNLPLLTAVAKVPSLAWSATPPQPATWFKYLGLNQNLISLVGHGQQHNEGAWNLRAPAALRYLFPGAKPD